MKAARLTFRSGHLPASATALIGCVAVSLAILAPAARAGAAEGTALDCIPAPPPVVRASLNRTLHTHPAPKGLRRRFRTKLAEPQCRPKAPARATLADVNALAASRSGVAPALAGPAPALGPAASAAAPAPIAVAPAPGVALAGGAAISLDRRPQCEAMWSGLAAGDPARAPGKARFLDRCLVDCPSDRLAGEGRKAFGARLGNFCEVRWRAVVPVGQTGGLTRDEYVDSCLHRCASLSAPGGSPTALPLAAVLGGAGAAGLGAAVATTGGGSRTPTSP